MRDGLFRKFHASGNEFLIYFWNETRDGSLDEAPGSEWARELCDRDTGIGADGLIIAVLNPAGLRAFEANGSVAPSADLRAGLVAARIRLWNSDGSEAAVSGNCLRCLTHGLALEWKRADLEILVDTRAGSRWCSVLATDDPDTFRGVVEMKVEARGNPTPEPTTVDPAVAVEAFIRNGGAARWDTVDVGNPHIVLAVADPNEVQLDRAGLAVQALFQDGINVHFASLTGEDEVTIAIWERGAGATDACGTGAVATAEVFRRWNLVGDNVTVHMPGGDAVAEFAAGDLAGSEQLVMLSGPTEYVDSFFRHSMSKNLAGLGSGLG